MAFLPTSAGGGLPPPPNLLSGSQGRGGGLTDPERPSLPGGGIPPIPQMDRSTSPSPPPMQANAIKNNPTNGMDDLYALDAKASFVAKLMKKLSQIPPELANRAGIDPADITTEGVNEQAGLPPGSNAATVQSAPNGQASAPPPSMSSVGRGMVRAANMNPGPGLS